MREALHARRPWSLWSPFSHPSCQNEGNLGAAQVERMERSQTSKFWGSGVGSQALATAAAEAQRPGRVARTWSRGGRTAAPGGPEPGLADQAGADGGVPALGRQREAAARAGPRAAARVTRDLRLGRTTGCATGATGRRPAEGVPRMAGVGAAQVPATLPSGVRKAPSGLRRAHATGGSSGLCAPVPGEIPGPPHPHLHPAPILAPARELTSPGAPGAGAPTLAVAAGPAGRIGRGGSCWLRRAICLCSRSTSRWDSRSRRSKSRTWSHWGPSWGWWGQGGESGLALTARG